MASVQADLSQGQMQASFREFLDRAVPVLATIPAAQYDAVLEALGNPAVIESFASLNKLAAVSKSPRLRSHAFPTFWPMPAFDRVVPVTSKI